jgi:hypothetical protein
MKYPSENRKSLNYRGKAKKTIGSIKKFLPNGRGKTPIKFF